MAKKDGEFPIDQDRGEKNEPREVKQPPCNDEVVSGRTEVKNAHASGLGSMGRTDGPELLDEQKGQG